MFSACACSCSCCCCCSCSCCCSCCCCCDHSARCHVLAPWLHDVQWHSPCVQPCYLEQNVYMCLTATQPISTKLYQGAWRRVSPSPTLTTSKKVKAAKVDTNCPSRVHLADNPIPLWRSKLLVFNGRQGTWKPQIREYMSMYCLIFVFPQFLFAQYARVRILALLAKEWSVANAIFFCQVWPSLRKGTVLYNMYA
jgi:hypothetical protein